VSEEDLNLARRLLAGDTESFEQFVESYRKKLFQYTYLMCGHHDDAEEVAQETLIKVFSNLEQLREPERLKSWVFRIAKNECLMKRRRSVFAPQHEVSLDAPAPADSQHDSVGRLEIADWSRLPDDAAQRNQLRGILRTAILELPPTYRAVVLLRDVEEMSTEETASILDVSTDVVKTRLHRARLTLRQKLGERLRPAAEVSA